MLPLLVLAVLSPGPAVARDSYGVPHVRAASFEEAFFDAGYAVAEDRLWQMETSRRLTRGEMAEVFGPMYVASDREILQTGYTDEELQTQLDHLSAEGRTEFREYARGVNAWIEEAKKSGLPDGYQKYGFAPRPWTDLDSVAISIRLLQLFGRGGAGELRNMALLAYLQTQPKAKARALDILDDFAWFNDPSATTTVSPADDPVKTKPDFYYPDRATTVRQLHALPKLGIFELMAGLRVSSRETSTRVAESIAAPFETGSYCTVVSPKRSGTGRPLLLSGPQMGFRTPSIIHEMSITAPGLSVVGMDIPGVPGIVIGYSPNVAWGLTSGVADTDDIIYYSTDAEKGYVFDGKHRDFEMLLRPLRVKGGPDQTVTELRTVDGPVVLSSASTHSVFAKKSSYWMHELDSTDAFTGVWRAKNAEEVDRAVQRATMNFNFFYATSGGDIGYRYVGVLPLRATGLDPRFPTPGGTKYAWRGMIPPAQMPHVLNPSAGFLANWNNKSAAWWPNGDTPVWGRIFHNSTLLDAIRKPQLNAQDLEMAAWTIARTDETWPYFEPYVKRALAGSPALANAEAIAGFDGRLIDGSRQAATYVRFVSALREELLLGTTGNFLSPAYFQLVGQPSVMLRALERRTKVDYLNGRTADAVVRKALERALASATADGEPVRYAADGISVPNQPEIPYSNRGSYIQVVEFLTGGPSGRDIVTPGVSESGPHAQDQADLARAWLFKPMHP